MTEYVPAALLLSAGQWYVVASGGRVLAQATSTVASGSSPRRLAVDRRLARSERSSGTNLLRPAANASPTANVSPVAGGTTYGATPEGTSSPSSSPLADASPTTLPQPGAGVGLPRGARHLPVVVSSTPVSVGTTVADPHVRQALAVLAALPTTLRRTALGARATDTSIIVYGERRTQGRVRRRQRARGQGPVAEGGAGRVTGRTTSPAPTSTSRSPIVRWALPCCPRRPRRPARRPVRRRTRRAPRRRAHRAPRRAPRPVAPPSPPAHHDLAVTARSAPRRVAGLHLAGVADCLTLRATGPYATSVVLSHFVVKGLPASKYLQNDQFLSSSPRVFDRSQGPLDGGRLQHSKPRVQQEG